MEPTLLKPAEAARFLSISTRKLWEITNCRKLACVRLGRMVRYKHADLHDYVQRNRRAAL